jgi:hypothetical protein
MDGEVISNKVRSIPKTVIEALHLGYARAAGLHGSGPHATRAEQDARADGKDVVVLDGVIHAHWISAHHDERQFVDSAVHVTFLDGNRWEYDGIDGHEDCHAHAHGHCKCSVADNVDVA